MLIGGVAASFFGLEETVVILIGLGTVGCLCMAMAWVLVVPVLAVLLVLESEQRSRMAAVVLGFVPASLLAAAVPIGVWIWAMSWLSVFLGTGSGLWSGGSSGRPLRVAGRQLHPELRAGSDWTRGDRPSTDGVSQESAVALEALWLHDAQKEHASVPAFSRVAWMLAAVGAPAELLRRCHVAGLEEIDHAERCFALAAGFGGRSHSVEPMPDLMLGGLSLERGMRPLDVLAVESVRDGCLLEDFNADVARRCHAVCTESATKEVLRRIMEEERSHAEFSWDVVAWALQAGDDGVRRAVAEAFADLQSVARPTATTPQTQALVDVANANELRSHGRIADAEWDDAWQQRVAQTLQRGRMLLESLADVPVTGVVAAA
ncbi:MAG: hypothetical protein ACJAZO_004127 [Myxococcota bacterium]|jgi:hypothetical protein